MKDKVNFIWKIITPIIRNKYLVSIIVFIVWISFFDTYSLIDRYSNLNNLSIIKSEHQFFMDELELYKSQYNELFSGKQELEKFAREQYLMKAENEEIFIIVMD